MFESFWEPLDGFEKLLWSIALLFTFVFILQSLFTFLSGGDESAIGDSDEYIEADGGIDYQFFTLRNLVIFFSIFAWIGIGCYKEGLSITLTSIIGILSGFLAVMLMLWLMNKIASLKHDGTLQIKNAINKNGTVYLPIPPSRSGTGKVQIVIQESTRELDAITDQNEAIATGTLIVVSGIKDNLLIVNPVNLQ
jgi:membrane protein implicated in regulation of membrane protease activity